MVVKLQDCVENNFNLSVICREYVIPKIGLTHADGDTLHTQPITFRVNYPNSSNSFFNPQPEFIDSLLKNKEPTLIFNSRNYHPDFRLTLPSLFPLHFPFGHGGIEEDRRTHVSTEECLKHYLKISLPRFQHADIILVISHMYFRKKSFTSC